MARPERVALAPLLLSPRDAADLLGFASVKPVERLIEEGSLPVVRLGAHTRRIPLAAVKKLVEKGTQP